MSDVLSTLQAVKVLDSVNFPFLFGPLGPIDVPSPV